MKRLSLALAVIAVLALTWENQVQAATMSQSTAAAVAIQATGFHPGHPGPRAHYGRAHYGHRGPYMGPHRPAVVRYPAPPVVVLPYPPAPRPVYYYGVPQSGISYQGNGWAFSIGF